MGMEAKCGGLAVATAATVRRRPLQPRDTNVAASTVVVGKVAPKPKTMPNAEMTLASPSPPRVKPLVKKAQCGVAVVGVAEASLGEELERARERRARLRAAREQTRLEMEDRAEALDREVTEWERRAEEQQRLVAELMRLIGMPEVYTPVESLRSKEEKKRREAIAQSALTGSASTSTAAVVQTDTDAGSCSDQESEATGVTVKPVKTAEMTS